MKEQIVLTKQDDKKADIVYIRIPLTLLKFVDGVAKQLDVKRSEAIRRMLQQVRDQGVRIE